MSTERIIGIDLGTSTSVLRVKTYIDGIPEASPVSVESVKFNGQDTLPTLAFYDKNHEEYLMGDQAEREMENDDGELFRNFKLDLLSTDPNIRQKAEDLIRRFFEYMYEAYSYDQENFTLCDKETTYVSYPAKWPPELADAMLKIASEAGFKNVQGMDEPSAAIQTVLVQKNAELQRFGGGALNVLMIDMGAGTTDLALCRHTPGKKKADILSIWPTSEGHALFGGREIDDALWGYVKAYIDDCGVQNPHIESQLNPKTKSWKENTVSTALKKNRVVTDCNFVNILFTYAQKKQFPAIDREVFEEKLEPYLKKFPELINGLLLNLGGISPEDMDLVILTGGHSQWYFVDEILSGKLTKFGAVNLPKIRQEPERIIRFARPQETVALGLAYQGINTQPIPEQKKGPAAETKKEPEATATSSHSSFPTTDSDSPAFDKDSFFMQVDSVATIAGQSVAVFGRISKGDVFLGDGVKVVSASGQEIFAVVSEIIKLENTADFGEAGEDVSLIFRGFSDKCFSRGDFVIKSSELTPEFDNSKWRRCRYYIKFDGIYMSDQNGAHRKLLDNKSNEQHANMEYYNLEYFNGALYYCVRFSNTFYKLDLSSMTEKTHDCGQYRVLEKGLLVEYNSIYIITTLSRIFKLDLDLNERTEIFSAGWRDWASPVALSRGAVFVDIYTAGKILSRKTYRLRFADDSVREIN